MLVYHAWAFTADGRMAEIYEDRLTIETPEQAEEILRDALTLFVEAANTKIVDFHLSSFEKKDFEI